MEYVVSKLTSSILSERTRTALASVSYPIIDSCAYYLWRIRRDQKSPVSVRVKVGFIKEFLARSRVPTFVETGTSRGRTVTSLLRSFSEIHTAEADEYLYEHARKKYAGYSHVHVYHGDSGKLLPSILSRISTRCIFWLDAHLMSEEHVEGRCETPIVLELAAIRAHSVKDHVILIDDARFFTGRYGYPTFEGLTEILWDINAQYRIEVRNDIICAHDKRSC